MSSAILFGLAVAEVGLADVGLARPRVRSGVDSVSTCSHWSADLHEDAMHAPLTRGWAGAEDQVSDVLSQ